MRRAEAVRLLGDPRVRERLRDGEARLGVDGEQAAQEAEAEGVNGAAEDLAGSWVYHLGLLQAYAQNHDSARPPASYVAPCGARLGRWLADQRSLDKSGRLAPARRQQLELIGGDVSPLAAHSERRWRQDSVSTT